MKHTNLTKSKTLEHMVGQMILAGFKGKIIDKKTDIYKWIKSYNLGGVLLYDLEMTQDPPGKRNIESPEQLKRLTTELQKISTTPLFISVDQEGGIVNRLTPEYGFPEFQSWEQIGRKTNFEETKTFSKLVSKTLKKASINFNLAPVLDIKKKYQSAISIEGRSISSEPQNIIKHSKIFIDEHRKNRIATCGKHFPGQGSAIQDAHIETTDISETWNEHELIPYKNLIKENKLDAIMIGHVLVRQLDNKYPASLSKKIVNEILRKKMGYNGLVICDDPIMKAISENYKWNEILMLMINAGIDLICLGNNLVPYRKNLIPKSIEAIISMVKNGIISNKRIYESYNRIQKLKSTLF